MKAENLLAGLILLFASCTGDSVNNEVVNNPRTAEVSVHISDFSVSTSDFSGPVSRASVSPSNYADVGELVLAFFNEDDEEVAKFTQVRKDSTTFTTFGDFRFTLPEGKYTLVAIGRDVGSDDNFTLTSPSEATYTSERVRETFSATQAVTVTGTKAVYLDVDLKRIITMLVVYSTDARPEGVARIRTTYGAGSKSFNPATGFALDDNGFSLTNTSSAAVGQTVGIANFAFLATDEETIDITLEALDAENNVLAHREVADVPFRRNRQTTLRGALFSSSTAITIETTWLPSVDVSF
ncbi:MAG: FimB/Mfa2 family fimbrial subunit [Prevotella sp.]|nr:FimB/Mfa2 family fimbrial subunit [Prevotella sp.]